MYVNNGGMIPGQIQFGVKSGEKYRPPKLVKRTSKGIFGKKTWDKF
jgi:hypothetical protein